MLLFIPSRNQTALKLVSTISATISLVLSTYVFFAYDTAKGGYQFVENIPWISSLGVSYQLGADGVGALMLLLTGVVIFCGCFVSWKVSYRTKDFYFLLLVLVAGVFGVFVSLDLFFFFFFYEIAVLPMYILIAVWGSTNKLYGAMKLTIMLVAGSVLIWVGLLAVYVTAGYRTFDLLQLRNYNFTPEFQAVFFVLLYVGFGILSGMWPFHTWSPDGHVAAPTAVSMLHAGVLMKLGAFGIFRIAIELMPEGARMWMPFLIVLATVNVIYGALSAMAQKDLKFVIGYSSVSHCGYVLMGFASLTMVGMNGAVLQMFSHGIMTALFFTLVGAIYDQAHTREIDGFGGIIKRIPIISVYFIIAGMASLGLPGLSGFVAEIQVFWGAYQANPVIGILAVLGVAITAAYILRLLAKVFFGPLNPKWEGLHEGNKSEIFGATILVAFLFIVGIFPSPFMNLINSGVAPLVRKVAGIE